MGERAVRINVLNRQGGISGCGFVVGERHAMTCAHVVEYALKPASYQVGDTVFIRHDAQARDEAPLAMIIEKLGEDGFDACLLRRDDGGAFLPSQTVLWRDGEAGTEYIGLGLSKNYPSISLSGRLKALELRNAIQLVTADDPDNRIEGGSSGAGLFALNDARMLYGMVIEFQGEQSGKIIPGSKLAEFWPELKAFTPPPLEPFPTLRPNIDPDLPVADLIRDVDRIPQRNRLRQAIERHDLLGGVGFLIAEVKGIEADLPDRCSGTLRKEAFQRIFKKIAPDAIKDYHPLFLKFDSVFDAELQEDNLLFALAREVEADSSKPEDIREAYLQELVPQAIVVTLYPHQLAQLPEGTAAGWAQSLRAIAVPEKDKPLALFVLVMLTGEAEAGTLLDGSAEEPWAVRLPALGALEFDDVDVWCRNKFTDDRAGEIGRNIRSRAEAKGFSPVDADGAAAKFRLRELESWLT